MRGPGRMLPQATRRMPLSRRGQMYIEFEDFHCETYGWAACVACTPFSGCVQSSIATCTLPQVAGVAMQGRSNLALRSSLLTQCYLPCRRGHCSTHNHKRGRTAHPPRPQSAFQVVRRLGACS